MYTVAMAGAALLLFVLWDGFETIILPRRVTRRFRFSRSFYRWSWCVWAAVFRRVHSRKLRDQALSAYGPLSMLVLLMLWAALLITSFGLVQWGLQTPMASTHEHALTLLSYVYMSGTTFLTLGLGDVAPLSTAGRVLTVAEAGTGFGFLAIVIGYLPVLYNVFSQREASIVLLDARAGTPATASELFRRHARGQGLGALDLLFAEWERWSAELLQTHISYPVLCYYRSQHDNQSWLGSLTTILDACSVVLAGAEGPSKWQAQLTFAIARHAVVDLAQILNTPPVPPDPPRLPPEVLEKLVKKLRAAGVSLPPREEFAARLTDFRQIYEPYVSALARLLAVTLPDWVRVGNPPDNWQTSAWERRSAKMARGVLFNGEDGEDDH